MEKNCLVTKYKATVNDASLKKLGSIIGTVVYSQEEWFGFNKVPGSAAKVIFKQNGQVVFEVNGGRNIPAGTYDVEFVDKYNITDLILSRFTTPIDTKELAYTKDLRIINAKSSLRGDIAYILNTIGPNTTAVTLSGTNVYGVVDGSILNNADKTKFYHLQVGTKISGTIESIAKAFANKLWEVDFQLELWLSQVTLNKKLFTNGGKGQYGVPTGAIILHRTENGCTVSRNDVLMATLANGVWTYES